MSSSISMTVTILTPSVEGDGHVCCAGFQSKLSRDDVGSLPILPTKTAQLLEALHAQDSITASSIPSGLLVANDSDYKRTHLLIHQSARLPSPALLVTNQDASIYPAIKIPAEQVAFPSSSKLRAAHKKQYQLLFDRILCDVPCSGDGTMRKNLGIWRNWQPMDGNGLHKYVHFALLEGYVS